MATEDELWQLVAGGRQGVLATVAGDGRPQLSNVLYVADAGGGVVRMSTTAGRVKARNLARDPRAALHVAGRDFWHYAVAEGSATLSAVASASGDEACRELLAVHSALYGGAGPGRVLPGDDRGRASYRAAAGDSPVRRDDHGRAKAAPAAAGRFARLTMREDPSGYPPPG